MAILGLLLAAIGGWKLYLLDRNGFYGDSDVVYAVLAGLAVTMGVGLLLQAVKQPSTKAFLWTPIRMLSFIVGIFALFWSAMFVLFSQ
jgi:uncharacterized membrane protein